MRIAVVTEGSTKHRNADVVRVLGEFDHEIINLGMTGAEGETDLDYMATALMSAICIHLDIADFVVGGCGTGQGYMNAVLQYPKMFCGLIPDPVEAWLFAQVNSGNCVSLQLNKGYGLAGDVNLRFLFEKMFSVEFGQGWPDHRREIQKGSRAAIGKLSDVAHLPFAQILRAMDSELVRKVVSLPTMRKHIDAAKDCEVKEILLSFA